MKLNGTEKVKSHLELTYWLDLYWDVTKYYVFPEKFRVLEFPSYFSFIGKRLINHMMRAMSDIDQDSCEWQCYLNNNCVSINLQFQETNREYELNNSTHNERDDDLISADGYFYRGTEMSSWTYSLSFFYHFPRPKIAIGYEVLQLLGATRYTSLLTTIEGDRLEFPPDFLSSTFLPCNQ